MNPVMHAQNQPVGPTLSTTYPFIAALSDPLGPDRMFASGVAFTVVAAFLFFWLLEGDNLIAVTAVVVTIMIGAHATTTYAVVSSLVAGQFDTKIWYSGTALSNALSGPIFGAPTPFIAEVVVGEDATRWWPLSLMTVGVAVISGIAMPPDTAGLLGHHKHRRCQRSRPHINDHRDHPLPRRPD